jgi:hypothetical protein
MKEMFQFFSLIFDVYRWSLFLASTGEHNSPNHFKDRERVLRKILMLVQVIMMAYQTAIITKVLEVGFTKGDDSLDVKYWIKFQYISIFLIILLFLIGYIIVLR